MALTTAGMTLSTADFEFVRDFARKNVGINLNDEKRAMVRGRLSKRARALGLSSISEYLDIVRSPDTSELIEFTNAITTNLTSFFREQHHFEELRGIIAAKEEARQRRLRIWSAACSTGQEPYSIAVTILDSPAADGWDVKVLATDVDSNVLAKAERGEYAAGDVATMSKSQLARFEVSPDAKVVRAGSAMRSMIRFRRLNLLDPWPVRGPFDVIFCRNVLIYFDRALQARLVDRFVSLLSPGGVLFLGHSESLCGVHSELSSCGKTMFRRRSR